MPDPVELAVFKNLYHSIAEEMGAALRRTSFSPNIKERRDYSCAVFDSAGQVIAMGDHMPVHLGSMPMSVAAVIENEKAKQDELEPGDVVMLNDPFRGGTHLPDITLVMPVYVSRVRGEWSAGRPRPATRLLDPSSPLRAGSRNVRRSTPPRHITAPDFYVASRAHHADVGGTYPGSMGPCREIYQEGLRIPPVKIMRGGKIVHDVLALVLNNVRTPDEREGDLGAQIAACQTGAQRLREICDRYGVARVRRAAADLLVYSEAMMRAFLRMIPPGHYHAEDFLDDDGVDDKTGTHSGDNSRRGVIVNAEENEASRVSTAKFEAAVRASHHRLHRQRPASKRRGKRSRGDTYSACFYVFRCLLREDVPATSATYAAISTSLLPRER